MTQRMHSMRQLWPICGVMILIWVLAALAPKFALAHGGGVPKLVAEPAGPYRIYAFVNPDPWHAGDTVHTSVAVVLPDANGQEGAETPVSDAAVTLGFSITTRSTKTISVPALARQGALAGYYEADIVLPEAGEWQIVVSVNGAQGSGDARFVQTAAAPAATPLAIAWISARAPAAFVLLVLTIALAVASALGLRQNSRLRRSAVWIRIALFLAALALVVVAVPLVGADVPSAVTSAPIDPATLEDPGSPFAQPALHQISDREYEVYLVAEMWAFTPTTITIPAGSWLTVHITSRDVNHGFKVSGSEVNLLARRGVVTTQRARFTQPGVYAYVCDQLCGAPGSAPIGHDFMSGQLIVK